MTHETAIQKHAPRSLRQAIEDVMENPDHWLHRDHATLNAFLRMTVGKS